MSHHDDGAEHVHDLIKDQRTAMLTTVHDDGARWRPGRWPASRPTPTARCGSSPSRDSEKAEEIRRRPDVNVAFTEEGKWVSVAGRASVTQDPARARELWNDFAQAWFQCEPEDPRVAVIRVDGDSAEYWDSPGKVGTLVGVLKAKVTGERPDDGESATVDL